MMPPNITATAAAMANVFIEPEHLLRTMVSFALRCFAATGLHARQVFQARRLAVDEVQVLARAPIIGLRTEIRHVNDESVTLPMAAGVAKPLADASRQMGAPVHDDIALPALPLTDVVEYRDAAGRLHDPAEAAAECGSELGQPARQATLRQTAVLRTVIAVHALGVVARRKVGASRRGRRIILAAATARRLAFACLGRLQQGKTEFPVGGSHLLPLRRQPWNPAIRRIDNQRRARPDVLVGQEHRVIIRAGDVELGPALRGPLLAVERRSLFVEFFPLCCGEKFLVRISGRALEGRVKFVRPNYLQVGLAPRRFQRHPHLARPLSRSRYDGQRNGHRSGGAEGGGGNGDSYRQAREAVAHDDLLCRAVFYCSEIPPWTHICPLCGLVLVYRGSVCREKMVLRGVCANVLDQRTKRRTSISGLGAAYPAADHPPQRRRQKPPRRTQPRSPSSVRIAARARASTACRRSVEGSGTAGRSCCPASPRCSGCAREIDHSAAKNRSHAGDLPRWSCARRHRETRHAGS